MGNADILIDIPVENNSLSVTTQFSFNYWITNKNAKATVSILFLKENGDFISSVNFADLSEKVGWDLFNQQFKIPGGTSVMRLNISCKSSQRCRQYCLFSKYLFWMQPEQMILKPLTDDKNK